MEARVAVEGSEVRVILYPFLVPKTIVDRLIDAIQSLLVLTHQTIRASDVVQDAALLGIDGQGPLETSRLVTTRDQGAGPEVQARASSG